MNSISIKLMAVTLLSLSAMSTIHAADKSVDGVGNLPAQSSSLLPMHGSLQQVNLGANQLMINATRYSLAADAKVYSREGEKTATFALVSGIKVAFGFHSEHDKNNNVISEIRILPNDADVAL